jgi:HSP20 family protein
MAQISRWIPESWRESLVHLYNDIHDIVEHWLPRRDGAMHTRDSAVTVRHVEPSEERGPYGSSPFFVGRGPNLEIDETDNDLLVIAELPGLDPDDFAIEISGERLVIRGEKKQESTRSGHGYTYSERRYGAFARALRLPCEIDTGNAKATYKQGVLRVTSPKTARAKASRVKVRVQG